MLGVMRFKSTGDMLTTSSNSEQFAKRRGASRGRVIRADSEEDVDHCGTNDDDDNNNNLEEHEELARTSRPLLFRASNVYNGADDDDDGCYPQDGYNGSRRQWKSCKLLGATGSGNRWDTANYRDKLEGSRQAAVRSHQKQRRVAVGGNGRLADEELASRQFGGKQLSKSTGDFLATLMLSREFRSTCQQPSRAATRVELFNKRGERDCSDDDDDDEERYDRRRPVDWLQAPGVQLEATPTVAPSSLARPFGQWSSAKLSGENLANSKVAPAAASKRHRRTTASGSRGKRRRAQVSQQEQAVQQQLMQQEQQPSRLSLSSPTLAQAKRRDEGQLVAGVGQLATLEQANINDSDIHFKVRGCQANEEKEKDQDQDQEEDDDDEVYADASDDTVLRHQQREQQGLPESLALRCGCVETKTSGEHCIVDVGQILEQRQQQLACQTVEASSRLDEPNCGGNNCDDQHGDFVPANIARKLSGSSAPTRAHHHHDKRSLEERLLSVCNLGVGGQQQRFYDGQLVALANSVTTPTSTCPFSISGAEQSPRDLVLPMQQQQQSQHGFFCCQTNQLLMLAEKSKPVGVAAANANVHCQKQQQENSKSTATTAAAAAASGSITNKLMLDLNSAANRLMDTCCNSWLGQTLQPTHFGSYKVNQPAPDCRVSISGSQQSLALQQEQEQREENSGCETVVATVAGDRQRQEHQQAALLASPERKERTSVSADANARIARYSRPGRSPISLQRQTNARLARHRLKIQQQRQEQLTQLTLRERRQLSAGATNGKQANSASLLVDSLQRVTRENPHCRAPSTIEEAIAIASNQSQQQQATPLENHQLLAARREQQADNRGDGYSGQQHSVGQESLYLINGLLDRLSFGRLSNRLPSSLTAQQQASHQRQGLLDTLQVDRLTGGGRHQVIEVPAERDRRPIEICDSQLAGSSRQQSSSSSSDSKRASQRSSGGNVIVYKSINMLQNKRSSMGSSQRSQSSSCGRKRATNFEFDDDQIESDSQTICSSDSTISLNRPFCKICHLGSSKSGDKLISPCRCSGTMQYIHCGCLLKWLEISNRSNEKPISCELCAHEYTWHKKFNYKQMRLPRCSFKDSLLHTIFVLAIGVMFFSALAPMLYRRSTLAPPTPLDASTSTSGNSNEQQQQQARTTSHNGAINTGMVGAGSGDITTQKTSFHISRGFRNHHYSGHLGQLGSAAANQQQHLTPTSRLAQDEKFMLLCAASFFVSFFVAIYVQTKARNTLYGLIVKFLSMNKTYYITEYDHGQLNGTNSASSNNNTVTNSAAAGNIGGNNNGGSNNSNNSGGDDDNSNSNNNCNGCASSRCGANDCDCLATSATAVGVNGTLK